MFFKKKDDSVLYDQVLWELQGLIKNVHELMNYVQHHTENSRPQEVVKVKRKPGRPKKVAPGSTDETGV